MTQAADDGVLVAQAQRGDRSAFDSLVRRYEAKAYQFAYRLTRDQDLASDIVADSFVRVFSAIQNFRGQSAFSTWLYRIVTNCYLDSRKKDKSKLTVSLEVNVGDEGGGTERQIVDESDGPAEVAERNAKEEAVQTALEVLPEHQKAMLVMYHVQMLSYEEIAEALDLPIGTVKSRLNRARLALREGLQDQKELFSTT
ncbi:MAG: sigma-70 family RNA polymerase sigma factor [Armatimonadetes bacterium]|nr:sigma-70 family RNA polymerase sigma factor [Armatimonadota bacterium]